jgi:hypothetical protein
MSTSRTPLAVWLCALVLALPLASAAAPLAAGASLPTLTLNDQHDKPVAIGASTRWIVFASKRRVSDMVNAVLSAEPAGTLERLQLVSIADISAMPAMVTRMFALPKLRELPYPVALVREGEQVAQVADLPRQPGSATLLRLQDGRIVQIIAAGNAGELRAALGLAGAESSTPAASKP